MTQNHKHLIVDLELEFGDQSPTFVESWLRELVSLVDMEVLIDPIAEYCDIEGNEGVTGIVVITTSHASIHIWEDALKAKFDLYSCKDFDLDTVLNHCKVLSAKRLSYLLIDRNQTFTNGYKPKTGVMVCR
jgi:S-adenosylmethionine/arginine decarboxylase-like enzyme